MAVEAKAWCTSGRVATAARGTNSNYDNLANSRYVVAVGALGPNGVQAS